MANHEQYQAPLDSPLESLDPEVAEAQQAWVDGEWSIDGAESAEIPAAAGTTIDSEGDDSAALSSEFFGRWHELVSRTNWEKGRIISHWRAALIQSGAASTEYSDEVWAQRVGGVTAPHVGRLRRVYDHFGESCESYPRLSWTHFLAAMDWDDAPLWLQGASDGDWSVAGMRRQRWETLGGDAADRPDDADVMPSETDEDFVALDSARTGSVPASTQPAQGGGSTKKYAEEPSGISSGPMAEGPDFGDDSLERLPPVAPNVQGTAIEEPAADGVLVQPFAGLPGLPDDLADAVELLKLAIVRHKAGGWTSVPADTVRSYLSAFLILVDARSR